jgi:hypothetical protein
MPRAVTTSLSSTRVLLSGVGVVNVPMNVHVTPTESLG